jgi:hypothetical protein
MEIMATQKQDAVIYGAGRAIGGAVPPAFAHEGAKAAGWKSGLFHQL